MTDKKHLLFIDDEPNILNGLRRMLRSKRHEWDCEFIDKPAEALERIKQQHFDMIVCDMRMPVIDGSVVLREAFYEQPSSIRILLSGQAEEQELIKVAKFAHQFLAKPCPPAILISTIERLFAIGDLIVNEELKLTCARINSLSSCDDVLERLTRLLENDASIDYIEELIYQDVSLVAKTLHLANFFYAGVNPVFSVKQALELITLRRFKHVLLEEKVLKPLPVSESGGMKLEAIWQHSIRVANYSKAIAQQLNCSETEMTQIVMAALLHDLGEFVVTGQALDGELDEHEKLSAYLLNIWGFSNDIVMAVGSHHKQVEQLNEMLKFAAIIHVSDVYDKNHHLGVSDAQIDQALMHEANFDEYANWLPLLVEVDQASLSGHRL